MLWEKVKEIEEKVNNIQRERESLEEELKKLPAGHVDIKKVGRNTYYYLRYWDEGKLKSRYLGKNAEEIKKQIDYSMDLRKRISLLREEEKRLQKVLERIKNAIYL
ncbi:MULTISPECIES: hypothetical protein [Acidianus]|uniref:DUF6788 domain-containing protein n=1 Tax=Candidatus Acidianus copahuensis TaxID=1160895 RepID=A0A031LRJ9_9CREN|nr:MULTISPECIES: hypothetical protein [Acidianus]EZQ11002.1 hypothetical protein CM19_01980 [Candidatus Acidianus copahuensis]NON63228.1 hypothetical protein [Acidianus sp. RZ1]